MDSKEFAAHLELLEEQINSGGLTPEQQARLEAALAKLHTARQQPADQEERATLGDTIDELATHFEAEHPTTAGVLRAIVTRLSGMGV